MTNDQAARASLFDCVSRALGIGAWSFIGHWSLVISHGIPVAQSRASEEATGPMARAEHQPNQAV